MAARAFGLPLRPPHSAFRHQMTAPSKEYLRYGEVQNWLEELGIGRRESRQLIALNVIKGEPLPGRKNGRDYYRKSQILRDVIAEEKQQTKFVSAGMPEPTSRDARATL